MQIVWTKHAEERQQQWEERLGITREEVEIIISSPQQLMMEGNVLVAHSQRGKGLVPVGKTLGAAPRPRGRSGREL